MIYLSFDCATKSLAFVLAQVNINRQSLNESLNELSSFKLTELSSFKLTELSSLTEVKLNLIKSNLINILDGETVDLFPNIPDSDISTVDRIKALVLYVRKRILPELDKLNQFDKFDKLNQKIQILIEFQMGANAKARMIFCALIAIFADYDVILVNPSLKNKIYTSEEGKHKHFIKKYSQLYSANKAHAKYNFELIENIFGSCPSISKSTSAEKGHIADAFMQILGHISQSEN